MTSRTLIRNLGLLAVAGLVLVACDRRGAGQPKAPTAGPPAQAVQVQPPISKTPTLSPYGFDKITIGMAEAEAVKLGGLELPPQGPIDYRGDCHELITPKQPGLSVMIQAGKVSRVTVTQPLIATDRGLRIGATEPLVRQAYGDALQVTPHKYEAPPAHYLTFWVLPGKRGIRYETDSLGIVTAIHGGDQSIELVESCL